MKDTICAISTTLGVGAISIIRVSGDCAIQIVNSIFNKDLLKKKSHTITYGNIVYNGEIIDEVLVTIMKSPKTFTVEDVVEINCHGGIATTKKVLEILLLSGCRLSEPGEFTKRAFLNGRIDLTKAQAVMDLINVKTEKSRQIAIKNLNGKTSTKIKELRNKLLDIISNIEVNIDYPEYLDIEEMTKEKVNTNISFIEKNLNQIIENSRNAKVINDGIDVLIIGRPNVGKSSILNKILGEEKAIVTDIAGTTRDIVEGSIIIDDMMLNFIDTAGIRKTSDVVEKIGVSRSLKKIDDADLVIVVLNNNEEFTKEDKELLDKTKDKKRIIVINKDDLDKKLILDEEYENIIYTNTLSTDSIDKLISMIKKLFDMDYINTKDYNYVSNVTQFKLLEEAKESLNSVKNALGNDLPIDMIEIDLKNIFTILGEIIGESYTEEILDNLFKNFCVGK